MKQWLTLFFLLTIPCFACAQTPPAEPEEILKIETQEVLLPVTVRDRSGQFITNLKAEDFRVYEENTQQPITSLTLKRLPVNVVLLLDTSSSVTKEIEDFKIAAQNFAAKLDAQDQLSLIKFDDKVELVMDWTANRATLKRALNRLTTGMFTNFNDALWLTAREQFKRIQGRKAIIILTDGIDSGRGRKTQEQALRAILEAEAPVFVVSKTFIQRSNDQRDLEFYEKNYSPGTSQIRIDSLKLSLAALAQSESWLTKLTDESGGRLFLPKSFAELDSVYQQVADELRSQYVLSYSPINANRDGRYRTVRVKTKQPDLHVTSRLGYYPR